MKKFFVHTCGAAALALALAGCDDDAKTRAQNAIAGIEAGISLATAAGDAYASLPRCTSPTESMCSDEVRVIEIQRQAQLAWSAVLAAEKLARRDGASAEDMQAAIVRAQKALDQYNGDVNASRAAADLDKPSRLVLPWHKPHEEIEA